MFPRYTTKNLYLIILIIFFSGTIQAQPANVLVSIKPLHSLISYITEGIGEAKLLLQQQQTPHHFQLRPSQKRMINQADIFFYSSDNIEGFVPALKNTTQNLQFIQLSKIPGIISLKTRSMHMDDGHNSSHHKDKIDGHIWLSVDNAMTIARYVSKLLSQRNPEIAQHYQQNLRRLLAKLNALKFENNRLLNKVKDKPYLVYHDAFQYFENENKLSHAYFVTSNADLSPGIKRLRELKQLIKKQQIQCVFYEPPRIPSFFTTLQEDSHIQLAALDPAGTQITQGKQHYFTLMQYTASTLYHCLKGI